jgi:hypothetical protein
MALKFDFSNWEVVLVTMIRLVIECWKYVKLFWEVIWKGVIRCDFLLNVFKVTLWSAVIIIIIIIIIRHELGLDRSVSASSYSLFKGFYKSSSSIWCAIQLWLALMCLWYLPQKLLMYLACYLDSLSARSVIFFGRPSDSDQCYLQCTLFLISYFCTWNTTTAYSRCCYVVAQLLALCDKDKF